MSNGRTYFVRKFLSSVLFPSWRSSCSFSDIGEKLLAIGSLVFARNTPTTARPSGRVRASFTVRPSRTWTKWSWNKDNKDWMPLTSQIWKIIVNHIDSPQIQANSKWLTLANPFLELQHDDSEHLIARDFLCSSMQDSSGSFNRQVISRCCYWSDVIG